ncbi:MAG TPA: hypothetical protein VM940_11290 [Chthoniobacterales bacterium]|jgi:outer membrane biosynthesis protein TonB|nr:hypothetical protein [Chthoniobacterales bacterium]
MNSQLAPPDELVFRWEKPGRGKWTLSGFLLGSLGLHAFGFYLFQIIYPPAVALLPPPGRVSLIAPNTDEGRLILRWVEAEDPALASTTQPLPETKALVLPTIQHAPSYLGHQPRLRDLPPPPPALRIPSARPPAPIEKPSHPPPATAGPAPTVIRFSAELESLIPPQIPELKFSAGTREAPQTAHFLVAVGRHGDVRHCFLQTSSGDASLDAQAHNYIKAARFPSVPHPASASPDSLIWATATVAWGNDIATPPSPSPPSNAP